MLSVWGPFYTSHGHSISNNWIITNHQSTFTPSNLFSLRLEVLEVHLTNHLTLLGPLLTQDTPLRPLSQTSDRTQSWGPNNAPRILLKLCNKPPPPSTQQYGVSLVNMVGECQKTTCRLKGSPWCAHLYSFIEFVTTSHHSHLSVRCFPLYLYNTPYIWFPSIYNTLFHHEGFVWQKNSQILASGEHSIPSLLFSLSANSIPQCTTTTCLSSPALVCGIS